MDLNATSIACDMRAVMPASSGHLPTPKDGRDRGTSSGLAPSTDGRRLAQVGASSWRESDHGCASVHGLFAHAQGGRIGGFRRFDVTSMTNLPISVESLRYRHPV